jgi:hypothetical protein
MIPMMYSGEFDDEDQRQLDLEYILFMELGNDVTNLSQMSWT